jgi:hypothetical protein
MCDRKGIFSADKKIHAVLKTDMHLDGLAAVVCPAGTPLSAEPVAYRLLHLRVVYVLRAVVVRTLAPAVVPAQAVYVAREGAEVRTGEQRGTGADNALQHAVGVGVGVSQVAAP